MIAAFDVHYPPSGGASAAAVLFADYRDATLSGYFAKRLAEVEAYVPGAFYRRELPCLLALIEEIEYPLQGMIVDGYVWLGKGRPGLGRRLFDALEGEIPVIGVAKTRFKGACAVEISRGKASRPLFVTAAGIGKRSAADKIRMMHGRYRLPTLLKEADRLAKEGAVRQSPTFGIPCSMSE
jgi:deoxyribonuclease V